MEGKHTQLLAAATVSLCFNPLPAGLGWKEDGGGRHCAERGAVSIPYRRGWVGRRVWKEAYSAMYAVFQSPTGGAGLEGERRPGPVVPDAPDVSIPYRRGWVGRLRLHSTRNTLTTLVSIPYRRGWVGRAARSSNGQDAPLSRVSIPYRRGWVGRPGTADSWRCRGLLGFNPLPAGLGWKAVAPKPCS